MRRGGFFLDPSEAFRLNLATYRGAPQRTGRSGFTLRRLRTHDVAAINVLYRARHMVPVDAQAVWKARASRAISYALAEDRATAR